MNAVLFIEHFLRIWQILCIAKISGIGLRKQARGLTVQQHVIIAASAVKTSPQNDTEALGERQRP